MALSLVNQLIQKIDSFQKVTKETNDALVADLRALITEKQCAPIFVRLAWHDAGTYCAKSKTGGPRAAQRFAAGESTHGANAGLDVARNLLSGLQAKYCNDTKNVSIADLWALAGCQAIEVSGGPSIPFSYGRCDISASNECVEEGRLPDADKELGHLRSVFHRMGLTDKDIVILSGAHTLGRCHADRSGFEGPWTAKPLSFDNAYFVDLVNKKWVPSKSSKGQPQLQNGDGKDGTMMLISDCALMKEQGTRQLVEQYAKDEKAFFNDFVVSWTKLIQSGYDSSMLYQC